MPKNFDESLDLLEEGDVPSSLDDILRTLQDAGEIDLNLEEELNFESK